MNMTDEPGGTYEITLSRGSLYLTAEIYQRYFTNLSAVILLRRNDDLLIMPVMHAAAGGYLLKLKNAAGDRVVNAMDFFREQGFDENHNCTFQVVWSSEQAALRAEKAFCPPD